MNTDPLSEAELARVIELDAKATEGPWSHYQMTQDRGHFRYLQAESHAVGVINTWPNSEPLADADLIAFYRTLCPRLARELLATREKLTAAREALKALTPKRERRLQPIPDYADKPIPLVPSSRWAWMANGDGSLYWATATKYAPKEFVDPSNPPKWATHVIYFGK